MWSYLLGELAEADEESFELRLLTDPAFGEEFDTVVDEITDQYVQNELQGEERQRVEKYFLTTTERQQKLKFASELLQRAEAERGAVVKKTTVRPVVETKPGLLEKFRAFWPQQSFAHFAAMAAVLVLVASVSFYLLLPGSYTSLDLAMNTSDRATGTSPARVKLPGGGLNLNLAIPESAKGAQDYRVKLIDGNGVERDLPIAERNEQSIKIAVPSASLARGSYVVQLFKVKPDGAAERVRGSYYFTVE